MFEKVNPSHPDKIADRIAGALVDLAYILDLNGTPKIAVEVLIGHGVCHIITESNVKIPEDKVATVVKRIAGDVEIDLVQVPQDVYLAENQSKEIRCGDNGIFRGVPTSMEEEYGASIARIIYKKYPTDGKYIFSDDYSVICQSNATTEQLRRDFPTFTKINPLGDWTGGTNVDTGATNRKLGSDMGASATGGGLMGKDISKADVSVNIYAWLKAQETQQEVEMCCAIGDTEVQCMIGGELVEPVPYREIIDTAAAYIDRIGGFEGFAEWGLL